MNESDVKNELVIDGRLSGYIRLSELVVDVIPGVFA